MDEQKGVLLFRDILGRLRRRRDVSCTCVRFIASKESSIYPLWSRFQSPVGSLAVAILSIKDYSTDLFWIRTNSGFLFFRHHLSAVLRGQNCAEQCR